MDLIVASDIHTAVVWDKIEGILPKEVDFLNPNHYFRKLLASLRKNQKLVINGDLVDYYYADHDKKQTNWDLFFTLMSAYKGEYFCTLGNHDYRSHPYNLGISGLKHVNLPTKVRRRFAGKIGYNKFKYLKEAKSLTVNLEKFNTLNRYPFKRHYAKKVDGRMLVFLDTGPDALEQSHLWTSVKNWPNLLLTIRYPNSFGISDEQIGLLQRSLNKSAEESFVFLHCPPFFAKDRIAPVRLEKRGYARALLKNKLFYGMFIENNWKFIETLIKSNQNITVIASHTHMPKEYVLDKKTQTLRESKIEEINRLRGNERYIKFINTLPLGAVRPRGKVGYLKITDDSIKHVVMKEFKPIIL